MPSPPNVTMPPNPNCANENPETVVYFHEICQSHPELEGTIIKTNVVKSRKPRKTRKQRMARVIGNIMSPFSRGRAKDRKFNIEKPPSSGSDKSSSIRTVLPTLGVHLTDSMSTVKALPPLPPMSDSNTPRSSVLPSAPPSTPSPSPPRPSTPHPSTPNEDGRSLTPISNSLYRPRVSVAHSSASQDTSFWLSRANEVHEMLGCLMIEEDDVMVRRFFHRNYTTLTKLLAEYNTKTADADALDKLVGKMKVEAIDLKHDIIKLVGGLHREYDQLVLAGFFDEV